MLGCGNNNAQLPEVFRYIKFTPSVTFKHKFSVLDEGDKSTLDVAICTSDGSCAFTTLPPSSKRHTRY